MFSFVYCSEWHRFCAGGPVLYSDSLQTYFGLEELVLVVALVLVLVLVVVSVLVGLDEATMIC